MDLNRPGPSRPPELPGEFQRAFDREKAKAELKYATSKRNPVGTFPELSRLIRIQEVFFAYCTQASNAQRSGAWTISEVSAAVEAAWPIICDGYLVRELHLVDEELKNMRTKFWLTVEDHNRWRQHLTGLISSPESAVVHLPQRQADEPVDQSAGVLTGRSAGVRSQSAKPPLEWEQIELFVAEFDMTVRVPGLNEEVLPYQTIPEFQDRRTGKPNHVWSMLRAFASLPERTVPDTARDGKEWEAIQKKVQRLGAALRKHFGLTSDPFVYDRGVGYRSRVKISSHRLDPPT